MPEDEASSLKRLVQDLVRAQGNLFIKKLLRDKNLPIGKNKQEFLTNLLAAIDQGNLTRTDFEEWLKHVEGWGHQHIYLYDLPQDTVTGNPWADQAAFLTAVERAGFKSLLNAGTSQVFPEKPTLTGVYVTESYMRLVWHLGLEGRERSPSHDKKDVVIDDDVYDFEAYRHSADRSVMRFELRPGEKTAAAFVQMPIRSPAHKAVLEELWKTIRRLSPGLQLPPFNVSEAMKRLDEEQLQEGAALRTQQARWSGQGAYVEFGATSEGHGYREVAEIREVRLALRTMNVSGHTATVVFEAPGERGLGREVRVYLYGTQGRIWVRSQ